MDQHFAIGNFIADGLADRAINIKAQHKVYRSYLYADDLVEWLMACANQANSQCQVFNVGSDEAVLMGQLAQMVAHEFGQTVNIPSVHEENVDRYVPDISKIREKLGVVLKYDLPSSITATVRAIRDRNKP